MIWPLDGANKGKTANEAKRNETETGHEANKGNDRQATEHDHTEQNETRRNESNRRAGAGELWPRVGGTSHMIP